MKAVHVSACKPTRVPRIACNASTVCQSDPTLAKNRFPVGLKGQEIPGTIFKKNYQFSLSVTIVARFQVLTAAIMKMTAFWDIWPYSLVELHACPHHQVDGLLL
jgi:hypothetical protein